MCSERLKVALTGLLLCFSGASCSENGSSAPASLRIFAFPNSVEPGGQATIVVEVDVPDCEKAGQCTLCIGVPPVANGGTLYPPAGLGTPEPGSVIALPPEREDALRGVVYVAPTHEGSEVVSAACYEGKVTCSHIMDIDVLRATTTVRLTIRKPGVIADAGPKSTDAGPNAADAADANPGDAGPEPVDGAPPPVPPDAAPADASTQD